MNDPSPRGEQLYVADLASRFLDRVSAALPRTLPLPSDASSPYATLRLPLTAALVKAGLGGLSMSTPGHRGGRFFGAWEIPGEPKPK